MGELGSGLQRERNRFVGFSFAAADLLLELDQRLTITFASGASRLLTDCETEALIGVSLLEMVSPQDSQVLKHLIARLGRQHRLAPTVVHMAATGVAVWLGACRLPADSERYFVTLSVVKAPNIERNAEAERDPETGTLGKEDFAQIAGELARVAADQRLDTKLTLLQLDGLDRLSSQVDDATRNGMLADIGAYLRSESYGGDSVGRLDGEKYGFVHDSSVDLDEVSQTIQQLSRSIDPAGDGIGFQGSTLDLTSDEAISDVDAGQILVYAINQFADSTSEFSIKSLSDGLDQLLSNTKERVNALKTTLARSEFQFVFQGIYSLRDGNVHHYEVLSRFPDEKDTLKVITFAENVGLIQELDLAVCARVIRLMQEQDAHGTALRLSVNLSGRSLVNEIFITNLRAMLSRIGQLRRNLLLEVTETSKIDDLAQANNIIQDFRRDGHRVCLDDFGAGAASFQYLQALAVDFVKIDGAYVQKVLNRPRDAAILKAMVGVSKDLRMQTIAECIETKEQLQFVNKLGVDYAQGYLLGMPNSAFN